MVEYLPMSDQQRPFSVIDVEREFKEEQEKQRRQFEDDQEQKRQRFEQKLESQKAVRDWFLVALTLIAVGAAYWTGYEARHSRMEATGAARESLDVQTEAMQLDERPYIRVDYDHAEQGATGTIYASIKITASGRTPSRDIKFRMICTQETPDFKLLDKAPEYSLDVLFSGNAVVPKPAMCNPIPNHYGLGAVVLGVVNYDDFFKKSHVTKFCYQFSGKKDWNWCDLLKNYVD